MKTARGWAILACGLCVAVGNAYATDWFVATNGNDSADGTNWATAKLTIQAAVDAAAYGNTIWVSNGVYVGLVTLNKGVLVRSLNGPGVTTIQGCSTSRCVTMSNAAAVVSGFTLTGGRADWGGGAYIDAGTLEGCRIHDNTASGVTVSYIPDEGKPYSVTTAYGGGVYGGILQNCEIYQNTAMANGWFMNFADAYGGGTFQADLQNCLVRNNRAVAWNSSSSAGAGGGGTYGGILRNCTIGGNHAATINGSNSGGGCNGSQIYNSIVWDNTTVISPTGTEEISPSDIVGGSTAYTCSTGLSTTNGNLTSDPRFMGAGNYRLQTNSPCLDAGSNALVQGTTDLDGYPRIENGRVDMGAYEGGHEWIPQEWYVATNGNDSADGATWATAKLTIQAAIDGAAPGETVWVSNGVYATGVKGAVGSLANRVAIDKPLTVQSVNGAEVTVIQGAGPIGASAVRCVYVVGGATLSGFTLTNGATAKAKSPFHTTIDNDGGGAVCEGSAILTNCILTGNSACSSGAGSSGGILNNCILTGNSSWDTGGGSSGGTLNHCLLVHNHADMFGGGGAFGGTLNDCTLASNTASYGGGAELSMLNRCILMDNTGGDEGGGAEGGTLNLCTLSGNRAWAGGGAASGATLNNCLLIGNVSTSEVVPRDGGGANSCTLNNCTVASNSAFEGGGVFNCTVVNSIVVGNTATNGPNWSGGTFTNSCTTPDPGGTGNITNDPQFVNAAVGNYRLSTDSPCIDTGNNDYVQGATDLDGNLRIMGIAVDMGVYESESAMGIHPAGTNLNYEAASGLAIAVAARVPWTATTNAPWLEITSGDSGTTNGTVVFSVASNGLATSRTGAVVVAGGGLSLTCTVVQAAFVPVLEIAPASTNLSADAASGLAIAVTANVPWTASTNVPWLEFTSGTSGTSNGTVVFSLTSNGLAVARTGAIIVASADITRTCMVVQAAFVPALSIAPVSTNLLFEATGGKTIAVTANVSWTATTNVPWLAITSGESGTTNGTVVFSVTSNGWATSRTGAVVVAGGGLSRTCTVVQAAFVPMLNIAPTSTNLACDAASGRSIWVTANVSWTATTNVPWLSITSGDSGTTNGTVVFSVEANSVTVVRTGVVVVAGGGLSRTCTVVQAAFVPVLTIAPTSTNLSADAASGLAIAVTANVPWTATTNVPWLAITSDASGTTNGTVVFSVTSNGLATSRMGAVVVAGGGLSRTCTVVQAAFVPVLAIDPSSTILSSDATSGKTIAVTARVPWTAVTNVPWLSITSGASGSTNGTVVFSVASNGPATSRTGAVIVAGGGLARTCMVVQAGIQPVLEIAPTLTNLAFEAASGLDLEVTANVAWTATTNAPWLAITSGGSGSGNGMVVFSVETNAGLSPRTGTIVVEGGGLSHTCRVVQGVAFTNWYVATDGNDSADGTTWATAKLTIQAAINAASSNDTVWVTNGTYDSGPAANQRIALSNAITLRSVNGARDTIIRGNNGRCISVTHASAVVSGFTITGGRNGNGAGVNMPYGSNQGLLEQCILVDNGTTGGAGSIWGGAIYGGRARNCLIVSNFIHLSTPDRYAEAGALGAGAAQCTLENCTLVDNVATASGYYEAAEGGSFNGTEVNCLIWSNWSGTSYSGSHWSYNVDNPRFADGDFHLSSSSPCINAGTNLDWMVGATDLDGAPRVMGGTVDIGCFEYFPFYAILPPALNAPIAVAPGSNCLLRSTNDLIWVQGTKPTNTWVAISSNSPDVYSTNGIFQESAGTTWSNLLQRNWESPSEIKTWRFRCDPIAEHTLNSSATTLRGTAAGLCGEPFIQIAPSPTMGHQAHWDLRGYRNLQTLEHMWISNQANGAVAFFDAPILPATNWTSTTLPLALGTNVLQVFGTNMLGDVAMAQHEVFLECHAGFAGIGSNGSVRVEWTLSTDAAITNQWQRSTNLLSGAWTNFGASFVATQEVECLIESNFNGAPAFFRMIRTGE